VAASGARQSSHDSSVIKFVRKKPCNTAKTRTRRAREQDVRANKTCVAAVQTRDIKISCFLLVNESASPRPPPPPSLPPLCLETALVLKQNMFKNVEYCSLCTMCSLYRMSFLLVINICRTIFSHLYRMYSLIECVLNILLRTHSIIGSTAAPHFYFWHDACCWSPGNLWLFAGRPP
jgi:hypothetical protein